MTKTWTLANIVTACRIGLAPLILIVLYVEKYVNHVPGKGVTHIWITLIATALFLAASASDSLDGYLARSRGEVTTLGKFLDPLADKVLVTTCFVMLVSFGWVPAWVVILIILREMAVTGLRSIAVSQGVVIAAGNWGKAKTVVQIMAITLLMVHYPHFGLPFHALGTVLLYAAFILTMYSGWDYLYKYFSSAKSV